MTNPTTPEELVQDMKECEEDRLYFEICGEDAGVLYRYIWFLELNQKGSHPNRSNLLRTIQEQNQTIERMRSRA